MHAGIIKGTMTTTHSYTGDQRLLDASHRDLRRARAAALNIVPTSTGAAKAVALVLPNLKGKLNGIALRVPTPNVSVVDLVVQVSKKTLAEEVNQAFRDSAATELSGILEVCDVPLVSVDFRCSDVSSTIDSSLTMVMGDDMVKVVAWYDNEWGYRYVRETTAPCYNYYSICMQLNMAFARAASAWSIWRTWWRPSGRARRRRAAATPWRTSARTTPPPTSARCTRHETLAGGITIDQEEGRDCPPGVLP